MGVPGGSQGDDFKAKARQSGEGCADWVPTFGFGVFEIKILSNELKSPPSGDFALQLRRLTPTLWGVAWCSGCCSPNNWLTPCMCFTLSLCFRRVWVVWGAKDLFQGVLHTVHVSGEGGKYGENLPDLLLRFNFRLQGGSLADLHPDTKVIFKPWVCPIPKAKIIYCLSGKRLGQAQIKYVWVILNLQIKKGKKSPI